MQDGPPAGTPLVLFNEIEPGIAILTLNRPQARNALKLRSVGKRCGSVNRRSIVRSSPFSDSVEILKAKPDGVERLVTIRADRIRAM